MNRDISRAIKVLAKAGYAIDRDQVVAQLKGNAPTVSSKDQKHFRHWCAQSWASNERFAVGYSDRGGEVRLVFQSLGGLERRQAHAKTIRSKIVNGKNGKGVANVPSGTAEAV